MCPVLNLPNPMAAPAKDKGASATCDGYLVRCTTGPGWAIGGMYAVSLTPNGMVGTWHRRRARRFPFALETARFACRLEGMYTGTAWEVCHA